MNADKLYKRILNRADMQGIPISMLIKVCLALLDELPNCMEEIDYE